MNKKMRIRLVAVLLALMILVGLSACASTSATADQATRITFIRTETKHGVMYDVICDEETGVEYLVVCNDCITPLYNPDGTLKTKGR